MASVKASYVSLLPAQEFRELIHLSINEKKPVTFTVTDETGVGQTVIEASFKVFSSDNYTVGSLPESDKQLYVFFAPKKYGENENPRVVIALFRSATPTSPR